MKAFVLGAGLGTRLQPLTEWLPKPLVPVFHRPLISYAFDHLRSAGDVTEIMVNTHHCAEAYRAAFPRSRYRGLALHFRHETELLETAGGIANIADWLGDERFVVYNGDILTDVSLASLRETHALGNYEVTLLLRRQGPGLHIHFCPESGRVLDIRGKLETKASFEPCQFTGIYLVEPAFLKRLTAGKKESVIPHFLRLIEEGLLGGCVDDGGQWWDLGDAETYRRVHWELPGVGFPRYEVEASARPGWEPRASSAVVESGASVGREVVMGSGARIGAGAVVRESVLWPGAQVAAGERVERAVVRGSRSWHYEHFFPDDQ